MCIMNSVKINPLSHDMHKGGLIAGYLDGLFPGQLTSFRLLISLGPVIIGCLKKYDGTFDSRC